MKDDINTTHEYVLLIFVLLAILFAIRFKINKTLKKKKNELIEVKTNSDNLVKAAYKRGKENVILSP